MVRVVAHSEVATSSEPACVDILRNGDFIARITATIENKQGADGGFYPVIKFDKEVVDIHEPPRP